MGTTKQSKASAKEDTSSKIIPTKNARNNTCHELWTTMFVRPAICWKSIPFILEKESFLDVINRSEQRRLLFIKVFNTMETINVFKFSYKQVTYVLFEFTRKSFKKTCSTLFSLFGNYVITGTHSILCECNQISNICLQYFSNISKVWVCLIKKCNYIQWCSLNSWSILQTECFAVMDFSHLFN